MRMDGGSCVDGPWCHYQAARCLLRSGEAAQALQELRKIPNEYLYQEKEWLILKAECLQQVDTEKALREAVAIYDQLSDWFPRRFVFLYRCAQIRELVKEWLSARNAYAELMQRAKRAARYNEEDRLELQLYQEGLARANRALTK